MGDGQMIMKLTKLEVLYILLQIKLSMNKLGEH